MKNATQDLLHLLQQADWFSRTGLPIDDPAIVRVGDWVQAMESLEGFEWYRVSQVAPNALTSALSSRFPLRYRTWNALVGAMLPVIGEIVDEKIARIVDVHRGAMDEEIFRDSIEWDLLHACMELEFADLIPVGFFSQISSWYVKGHLPCGWSGTFPAGSLVVY